MYVCLFTDEWEEMCVVPVSEQISRALQTEGFQDLLASLGLQAPTQQVSEGLHHNTCLISGLKTFPICYCT